MKVKALDTYQKLNVTDKELNKICKEGEEFEVTEERFKILSGNNIYKAKFVEKVKEIEIARKKVDTEKAINKTAKKVK